MFCKTHALAERDAEAVEERGLSRIWVGNAAQADVAVGCGGQDNVVRLNGASSSRIVRGALPRPERLCHISRLFHSTKARKQTRIWAWTRSSRWCQIGRRFS